LEAGIQQGNLWHDNVKLSLWLTKYGAIEPSCT
jgi:hypothetical protein